MSPAQLARARRLLALESAEHGSEAVETTAAGRVYDRLHAHLAPLVGVTGVESLFLRSAKLTGGEFAAFAEVSVLAGATMLRERLKARDPAVSAESAAALFGSFLTLLTTFLGERLISHVLSSAWPKLEDVAPRETGK